MKQFPWLNVRDCVSSREIVEMNKTPVLFGGVPCHPPQISSNCQLFGHKIARCCGDFTHSSAEG
jgi:hypothetical protein